MKLPTGLDVAIEVYGIIYIYNPVDRSKLGVEGGEEGESDRLRWTTSHSGLSPANGS